MLRAGDKNPATIIIRYKYCFFISNSFNLIIGSLSPLIKLHDISQGWRYGRPRSLEAIGLPMISSLSGSHLIVSPVVIAISPSSATEIALYATSTGAIACFPDLTQSTKFCQ